MVLHGTGGSGRQFPTLPCRLGRPLAVIVVRADHLAILPTVARHRRADYRNRALRLGIGNELTQVPTVAVHDLGLTGHFDDTPLGLIAVTLERCPGPIALEPLATIVMAKLDDQKIARAQALEHSVPAPFGEKRAAAAATDGMIFNIDAAGIKVCVDELSPPPQSPIATTLPVLDGRITDKNQAGSVRFGGARPGGTRH